MAQTSLLLVACLLALSQPSTADDSIWVGAASSRFVVITDGGAAEATRLVRRFERLRRVFSELWPTARPGSRRVFVVAPAGRHGLTPLLPADWSSDHVVHPIGKMVSGLDRVFIAVPAGRSDLSVDAVAVHEYVHLLVDENIPSTPLWLNEGLAEFFAAGRLDESPAVFGLPHVGHLQVLRARPWLPTATVLSATRGTVATSQSQSAAFYAQAWLLVHFLKLADGGAQASQLTRFTAAVAQGIEPSLAARDAFGPLDKLEERLQTYVSQGRFYDARLPLEPATDETRPVPVAQWEATMALGDFLTHVLNHDEAEQVLDKAALEAPQSAEVLERQALLAFGRNRPARALLLADRALAIDPTRSLAHHLRAVALLADASALTAATTKDAEASLRRAIAFAPSFAPAYSALGGLLAARDGSSLEAVALIQRAIALDPSSVGHQVTLGQVLLMSGETVEAQWVAERARAAARTATERETVERLLAATLGPSRP
jgi:tetratricopeptide (TPR) repeat protein